MRRAVTLAMVTAAVSGSAVMAQAQMGGMGQAAMAPSGGVVNRAINGFQNLNQNGPGWLYYGINAADRGLGYNGSYMTLGGFVPYAEDDLGGFWAADLRGHLSEYGGFFSNVGFVRKQFLGGSLLGVGVYWDYDGDQNQYPAFGVAGSEYGQFGHSYHQVGISGEWLTDYGNIRSNGYIPVGTTAYTAGNPGSPFYQNYVMCQYGLDAALSGADLEVGAYIPGLADWAGMISVGGYALGNARYDWNQGPLAGKDVVPYFGGVYTRLDMTFIENWDFSLQANNDSYFDWTGFARLTYRMGGSRRRNVPDQMEQPMMRNEHIVRAHQTPIMAINPSTGTPWRVIHVNNAAPSGGTGTAEAPVNTLVQGSTAATNPWDIVFVHQGLSRTTTPYGGTFAFQAQNQFLVGDGGTFMLPTFNCGPKLLSTGATSVPLLSNPGGDSIAIVGPNAAGATVADLDIIGSSTGIYAANQFTSTVGRPTTVQNVTISGNGTSAPQTGVYIENGSGTINFTDTAIENMTDNGLAVVGGDANVTYQGSIKNDTTKNGGVSTPIVRIQETTGGTVNVAVGGAPSGSTVPNEIVDIGGTGIQIIENSLTTTINMSNVSLKSSVGSAIAVINDNATTTITAGAGSGVDKDTVGAAITVEDGGSPTFAYSGPIKNARPIDGAPTSYLLNVSDVGGKVTLTAPAGSPFIDSGDGIRITKSSANVLVGGAGAIITSSGGQGILIDNGSSGTFGFNNVTINKAGSEGVLVNQSPGTATFSNLNINLGGAATGFRADNSGAINVIDTNTVVTSSTTAPAVSIRDTGPIAIDFAAVSSGVPNATGTALEFLGTSTGQFSVSSSFTVGGSPGTATNNVSNPAGVTLGGILTP